MLRVTIFDDVLAARGERFTVPGVQVELFPHADDAAPLCTAGEAPDSVLMDYAMGPERKSGAEAVRELRRAGFAGEIVAISSDAAANAEMLAAGADRALAHKREISRYLDELGARAPG